MDCYNYNLTIVIDEHSSQESIWTSLGIPILNKAFNGYNGTIFAYGKSHINLPSYSATTYPASNVLMII